MYYVHTKYEFVAMIKSIKYAQNTHLRPQTSCGSILDTFVNKSSTPSQEMLDAKATIWIWIVSLNFYFTRGISYKKAFGGGTWNHYYQDIFKYIL